MTLRKLFSASLVVLLFVAAAAAQGFPAGTRYTVRVNHELSSGTANAGDAWDGVLTQDVVSNGKTLAKSGAPVRGKVVSAKSSGRLHAPGILSIRLTQVDGKLVSTGSRTFQGKSHKKSNITKIGGGAAAGALIGGLAGGGKGALIGSAVGAGAGTGVAAATGKMEAVVPAESALSFTQTK